MAFTEVVRRHRNLVFAVALATVGDAHLAEDITQETFLAAFLSLRTLENPASLPTWLRRIARRQCARALRRKRVPTQPLDSAGNLAADLTDPAAAMTSEETRATVFRALWRIPATQREAIALHYIEGMSQRDIAALLGLPVTTVNNRMHEGRLALRHELTQAATESLRHTRLSARFADRVGTILRVRGPVVDVRFEVTHLPDVLETIAARDEGHKRDVILEVVQRRGHGVVRCLASSAEPISPGTRARRLDGPPAGTSLRDDRAAIAALQPAGSPRTKFLETGIKAIDLFCPLRAGGTVAIMGDAGVGKLVLVQELARRLADVRGGLGVFTFVRLAERPWARSVAAALDVRVSPPDLTFFLAALEHDEPNEPDTVGVDALIYMSRSQAEHQIYPAIDPVRSRSTLLTTPQVGQRHWKTAEAARSVLERLRAEHHGREAGGADDVMASRAWKLQLYLSQPLFVAQPFTKLEGAWVARRDTVAMCSEILAGRHDLTPSEAFWFVGGGPRGKERRSAATRSAKLR